MSANSKQQFKFFKMLENNPKLAKKKKINPKVAAEYTKSNKGKMSYKNLPDKK